MTTQTPTAAYEWPALGHGPYRQSISADQIERIAERATDHADALFMAGKVSQADYDRRMKQINAYAESLYAGSWRARS